MADLAKKQKNEEIVHYMLNDEREKDFHISPILFVILLFSTLTFAMNVTDTYYNEYIFEGGYLQEIHSWFEAWYIRTLLIGLNVLIFFFLGTIYYQIALDVAEHSHLFIKKSQVKKESFMIKLNKAPLRFILITGLSVIVFVLPFTIFPFLILSLMAVFKSGNYLGDHLIVFTLAAGFFYLFAHIGVLMLKRGESLYVKSVMNTKVYALNTFENVLWGSFLLLNSDKGLGSAIALAYEKLSGSEDKNFIQYLKEFDLGAMFRTVITTIIVIILRLVLIIIKPVANLVKAKYFFYILFIPAMGIIGSIYLLLRFFHILYMLFTTFLFYSLVMIVSIFTIALSTSIFLINSPAFEWFYYIGAFDFSYIAVIAGILIVLNIVWGLLVWSFSYEFDMYYNPFYLFHFFKSHLIGTIKTKKIFFFSTVLIGVFYMTWTLKYTLTHLTPSYMYASISAFKSVYNIDALNAIYTVKDEHVINVRNNFENRIEVHENNIGENTVYMKEHPNMFDFYEMPFIKYLFLAGEYVVESTTPYVDASLNYIKMKYEEKTLTRKVYGTHMSFEEAEKICEKDGFTLPTYSELYDSMQTSNASEQEYKQTNYWSISSDTAKNMVKTLKWPNLQEGTSLIDEKLCVWCVD